MPLPPRARGGTRRLYRDLVLGTSARSPADDREERRRVLAGTILDADPYLLVLDGRGGPGGEITVPLAPSTTVWHGGRGGPAALRPGREAIVRMAPDGPVADRVWVDIGRITGTILEYERDTVEVDSGPHRGHTSVVIPPHALGRVLVRHPRLEPGHLIDLICVRSPDGPRAARPGTSQPGYLPADLASPRPDTPVADVLHGTVTWFGGATYADVPSRPAPRPATPPAHPSPCETDDTISPDAMPRPDIHPSFTPSASGPAKENPRPRTGPRHASPVRRRRTTARRADQDAPARIARPGAGSAFLLTGEQGIAYPFVDPEDADACPDTPPGCVALPYLSLGTELTLQNECTGLRATLPLIECGCVAARYCDRCVECGTSPRGRLAELTPAAFVAFGGDLDAGCFNAALRFGDDPPHAAED
ncbi:hypothetical protein Acsp03_62090 [Actinomadura sp. NBRC 104412]|uniref:hypothetical protein n=1 Tax=Actinomadura sp. NBRC 104412 TaxID=3032203 RepID=UPI0024A01F15|nr:hypothetical protein [Actinomadura sp. NBRC 104412]GLZ08743.1 hypothetical protein Acsp03_62090 [Actinomadura sp. NBRC 104412]